MFALEKRIKKRSIYQFDCVEQWLQHGCLEWQFFEMESSPLAHGWMRTWEKFILGYECWSPSKIGSRLSANERAGKEDGDKGKDTNH